MTIERRGFLHLSPSGRLRSSRVRGLFPHSNRVSPIIRIPSPFVKEGWGGSAATDSASISKFSMRGGPLTRIACAIRPLPNGERCGAANAAPWITQILHLSPSGRGRLRSSRVRGLQSNRNSNRSVPSIISSTPSRLSYTSVFETRTMWKPQASSTSDRALSRARSEGSACVTPSTSTINFPSSITKSTTYRSIGCWRRNFQRSSRRLRSACQSFASALVCDARSFLALALNLSIALTSCACGSPTPSCCAADLSPPGRGVARRPRQHGNTHPPKLRQIERRRGLLHLSPPGRGRIAHAIRVRGLSAHPDLDTLYPSTPRAGSATNAKLYPWLPLTRPLRGRPLPDGERCSTAAAAV